MSAGCVRWVLNYSARTAKGLSVAYWSSLSRCTTYEDVSCRRSPFCTAIEDTQSTPASKKKKHSTLSNATINSVGRKIPQRLIEVISETGENMGTMHRSDVIRILDEQGLKLVLLDENQDPPVYRLMSGKQIHEEQLKLREKQKAKPVPVQVKELTFSAGIATHDLSTKLNQVQSWLEKKHHVRITLKSGRGASAGSMDSTLESLVQQMEADFGFVSQPKLIRNGQAAMCILRPPSAKELAQKSKKKTQSTNSASESTQTNTTPLSTKETTESSAPQ